MPILIDDSSPTYSRQLRSLAKTYRRAQIDIVRGFEEILADFKTACHATPVPGMGEFAGLIWKYRISSSDMNKGRSSGFRVMAYYDVTRQTLIPFCVYTHSQYANAPPNKHVTDWIKESLAAIEEKGKGTG